MSAHIEIARNGKTITVRVRHQYRRHKPRTSVVAPQGAPQWSPAPSQPNNAILKALGQSWRWKKMIEVGEFATLAELAKAEGVNFSYLCRVLRLTLLSPALTEALLTGKNIQTQLRELLQPNSWDWTEQEQALGFRNAVVRG